MRCTGFHRYRGATVLRVPGLASSPAAVARRLEGGSPLREHGSASFEAPSYRITQTAVLQPTLAPPEDHRGQLVILVQKLRQRVRDTETGRVLERTIVRGVPVARVDAVYNYQSPCDLLLDRRKILPEAVVENRLPLAYNAGFGRLPRNKLSPAGGQPAPGEEARDGARGAQRAILEAQGAGWLPEAARLAWERDFGGLGDPGPAPPAEGPAPQEPGTEARPGAARPGEEEAPFWNCDITAPAVPGPRQSVPGRQRECVELLLRLFMIKPAWTIDALREVVDGRTLRYRVLDAEAGVYSAPRELPCPPVSFTFLKFSLYHAAYQFRTGPFRKLWFRRGFDPRRAPLCGLLLQTVDYRISAEDYHLLPELCEKAGSAEEVARRCPPSLAAQVPHVLDSSAKTWVRKQPLIALCDFVHPSITPIVERRLGELRGMKQAAGGQEGPGKAGAAGAVFDERAGFLESADCATIREHAKTAAGRLLGQIESVLRGGSVSEAQVIPLVRNGGLVPPALLRAMQEDGVEFWKLE